MIVHNETALTGEEATNLLVNSFIKEYKKRYIFLALILLMGIAILVTSLVTKQSEFITLGAIVTALGVGFFIYSIIDLKKTKKRVLKNNPEICEHGVKYSFNFKENSVQIHAVIGGKNKKSEYSYQYLKSISENEISYELIFNQNDAIYVLKSGFEDKKMEEFFRKNITTTKKKIKYKPENKK